MIPYLLAVLGGYLIGDSMDDTKAFADGGILDSDVKDNVSDFLVHKLDTEDFEVYLENNYAVPEVKVVYTGFNDVIDIKNFLRESNQALFDGAGIEEYNSVRGPVPEFLLKVMADGGQVTFEDKVKAIAKRLEGTMVPKKLQKDYGNKYNKEESIMAARRIVGSQKAKYDKSKSKQGSLFADGGMTEVKKKIEGDISKLEGKDKETYEQELDYVSEAHWIDDRMMTDYINGWYGKDIIQEDDINDKNRDLGMKIIAYCSSRGRLGKKMSKGGMIEVRRQFGYSVDNLSSRQKKIYEKELKRIKEETRFNSLNDKDMADYINGWYGEDIVTNMDFTGPKSFDLGIKVLALYESQKHPEFWEEELMIAEKGIKTEGKKK